MKLYAYAKINLGLYILGKRPDNYHDLETVFHEVDLCDEITVTLAERDGFDCSTENIPMGEDNLCMQAVRLLQAEQKIDGCVHIALMKNIPIGAGLGGGSSDAAATLVALNKLWNLNLGSDVLCQYAAKIGSDVPFFIRGGSAYAHGRGEILEQLRLGIPFWIVLVTPPVHVSTAWAYRNLKVYRNGIPTGIKTELPHALKNPALLSQVVQNDFEEIIFAQYPVIQSIKFKLLRSGASFALMSGSGSSVFGLYDNEASARFAAGSFPKDHTVSLTAPFFNARND
ncbi:MAG: 4-(cytidine 5'-diphospho)-2-C-methyl-D-erythritol kinase [Bacteroidota bacterium]